MRALWAQVGMRAQGHMGASAATMRAASAFPPVQYVVCSPAVHATSSSCGPTVSAELPCSALQVTTCVHVV